MNWQQKMAETPFGQNTARYMLPMNSLTYSNGGRDQQPVPRAGYLARIHWHFTGTNTVTLGGGTATLDVLGPWNLLNRIRLIANSGQDIFSTSGFGAFLVNALRGPRLRNAAVGNALFTADIAARVYGAATAAGANAWEWGLTLPVAVNEESELGLILVQNEAAQNMFAAEWNSLAYSLTATQSPILVTGAATAVITAATIVPMIEYFAVPAEEQYRPDISIIHQVLESTAPIQNVGADNVVNLLRDNMYIDIIQQMILNNAPNGNDIDEWRLVQNQSDTHYRFLNRPGFQYQRDRFGGDLPSGVITYPLFDQGFPGFGDERDIINGRATSELQAIIKVASTATLGTNPRVNTITRQLVKLSSPITRQA